MMPYILGVQAIVLGVVGTWLVYHFKLRTVFRADFYKPVDPNQGLLRSEQTKNKYFKVGSKEFKADDKEVHSAKHGTFGIKFDKMLSTDGRQHIWAFDVETKRGLTFGGSHDIGDPDYAEDLLYSGVLKRFTRLVGSFDATTLLIIVVLVAVAVITFMLGLFVSPYILPQPVPVTPAPTPAPVV